MAYHNVMHSSARMRSKYFMGANRQLVLSLFFAIGLFAAHPAIAQICIFPQTFEHCYGPNCTTDYESTSDTGVGAESSVVLPERRARAQAGGGAGERAATAFVGIRFTPKWTTEAEIWLEGSYKGTLQGGVAPTSFGKVVTWYGLWNLTTGAIVEQKELFSRNHETNNVLVIPEMPLEILQTDFTAMLVEGNEYAVYFRLEVSARGLTSDANFNTGDYGLYFDSFEILPTTEHPDADGDGLFDEWEDNGVYDCNDNLLLDLPSLGATSDYKDIFIEYDWLPGMQPRAGAIETLKEAFLAAPIDAGGVANPNGDDGIRLWVDTGDSETGDDLGGGEEIDLMDVPHGLKISKFAGDADGNGTVDYYDIKQKYFSEDRRFAFHYLLAGGSGTRESGAEFGSCSDEIDNDLDGLIDDEDILDCFGGSQAEYGGNDIYMHTGNAGVIMHELGHNLKLHHGGDEKLNCKPNYVSVMNYSMATGIRQNSNPGQDTNGNGSLDYAIVDYAPPRYPGGRGIAPLPALDEQALDESMILDPSDAENRTSYVTAMGGGRSASLNEPIDWGGDGDPPNPMPVAANINSGSSSCSDSPPDEDPYDGHDDWANIKMNFRIDNDYRDAPVNPTEEPEPTQEQLDEILELYYTTDLSITKTVAPELVTAGQAFTINLLAENLGPNHTLDAEVRDMMPDGVEVTEVPAGCELSPAGEVICSLGHFQSGTSKNIAIQARVERDLVCQEGEQFRFISNTATIENLAGQDPDETNNSSTVRFRVLCVNYEYAAKLVCGKQEDGDVLRLMRGQYGTMVNIHNPNDKNTFFFKKLALAFPPEEQAAGDIIPIAIDSLAYDESLKTDCDELRENFFPEGFPFGYIEGHVVVQSPYSMDVQSVFTAAPLDVNGDVTGVSTIDVEYVPERKIEKEPMPDLVVVPAHPEPSIDASTGNQLPEGTPNSLFCGDNGGSGGPSSTMDAIVRNRGQADAEASILQISFIDDITIDVAIPSLAAGEEEPVSVQIPTSCYGSGDCEFELSADNDAVVTESDEDNNKAASVCIVPSG
ncbi:MAG: DUF11 domain-containing protein [Rhodothermaceae bacterium]|nr:DUF11 domain-containing protein [Rhodothermaceae bacterium]